MDLAKLCRRAQEDMTELAEEHGPPTRFATIPQRWPYDRRHERRGTSGTTWAESREGVPRASRREPTRRMTGVGR
jgi:hypothetical protein